MAELSLTKELSGQLSVVPSSAMAISGQLSQTQELSGQLTITPVADVDVYSGDYVVDANAAEDTILPTKRKTLLSDITVNKIQYSETTNPSGGITIYIG